MNSVISWQLFAEWSHKPGEMVRVDDELPEELEEGLSNHFETMEQEENAKDRR